MVNESTENGAPPEMGPGRLTAPSDAFLLLTLGEYMFDQWGGDWRKAVRQYSAMLDMATATRVCNEFQVLLELPVHERDLEVGLRSTMNFEVDGSSPTEYLRYAVSVLHRDRGLN